MARTSPVVIKTPVPIMLATTTRMAVGRPSCLFNSNRLSLNDISSSDEKPGSRVDCRTLAKTKTCNLQQSPVTREQLHSVDAAEEFPYHGSQKNLPLCQWTMGGKKNLIFRSKPPVSLYYRKSQSIIRIISPTPTACQSSPDKTSRPRMQISSSNSSPPRCSFRAP